MVERLYAIMDEKTNTVQTVSTGDPEVMKTWNPGKGLYYVECDHTVTAGMIYDSEAHEFITQEET